jgi:two-component system, response regulator
MIASSGPEILLVEDNLNDAELAIRALKMNYPDRNIVHVQDGEEALNYFFPKSQGTHKVNNKLPRLVLLDLKLPKVDGFEVLKILKNHSITRLIPVVILSSSAEKKDILQSYLQGANSYIVKPVDFDAFRETISNLGYYWLNSNQPVPDENHKM